MSRADRRARAPTAPWSEGEVEPSGLDRLNNAIGLRFGTVPAEAGDGAIAEKHRPSPFLTCQPNGMVGPVHPDRGWTQGLVTDRSRR